MRVLGLLWIVVALQACSDEVVEVPAPGMSPYPIAGPADAPVPPKGDNGGPGGAPPPAKAERSKPPPGCLTADKLFDALPADLRAQPGVDLPPIQKAKAATWLKKQIYVGRKFGFSAIVAATEVKEARPDGTIDLYVGFACDSVFFAAPVDNMALIVEHPWGVIALPGIGSPGTLLGISDRMFVQVLPIERLSEKAAERIVAMAAAADSNPAWVWFEGAIREMEMFPHTAHYFNPFGGALVGAFSGQDPEEALTPPPDRPAIALHLTDVALIASGEFGEIVDDEIFAQVAAACDDTSKPVDARIAALRGYLDEARLPRSHAEEAQSLLQKAEDEADRLAYEAAEAAARDPKKPFAERLDAVSAYLRRAGARSDAAEKIRMEVDAEARRADDEAFERAKSDTGSASRALAERKEPVLSYLHGQPPRWHDEDAQALLATLETEARQADDDFYRKLAADSEDAASPIGDRIRRVQDYAKRPDPRQHDAAAAELLKVLDRERLRQEDDAAYADAARRGEDASVPFEARVAAWDAYLKKDGARTMGEIARGGDALGHREEAEAGRLRTLAAWDDADFAAAEAVASDRSRPFADRRAALVTHRKRWEQSRNAERRKALILVVDVEAGLDRVKDARRPFAERAALLADLVRSGHGNELVGPPEAVKALEALRTEGLASLRLDKAARDCFDRLPPRQWSWCLDQQPADRDLFLSLNAAPDFPSEAYAMEDWRRLFPLLRDRSFAPAPSMRAEGNGRAAGIVEVVHAATGDIFVLVPSKAPGAQESNEAIGAFLLGKTEVTCATWDRLTKGLNPKDYGVHIGWGRGGGSPDSPRCFVADRVARAVLAKVGLDLPTETQWVHACLAGRGSLKPGKGEAVHATPPHDRGGQGYGAADAGTPNGWGFHGMLDVPAEACLSAEGGTTACGTTSSPHSTGPGDLKHWASFRACRNLP